MLGDRAYVSRNFSVTMFQKQMLTSEAQDSQNWESIPTWGSSLKSSVTTTLFLQVHYWPKSPLSEHQIQPFLPSVATVSYLSFKIYSLHWTCFHKRTTQERCKTACMRQFGALETLGSYFSTYTKSNEVTGKKSYLRVTQSLRNIWDAVKPQRNSWWSLKTRNQKGTAIQK